MTVSSVVLVDIRSALCRPELLVLTQQKKVQWYQIAKVDSLLAGIGSKWITLHFRLFGTAEDGMMVK
jgi:hypothetical protein